MPCVIRYHFLAGLNLSEGVGLLGVNFRNKFALAIQRAILNPNKCRPLREAQLPPFPGISPAK
jgi:hypothetical protein